MQVSRSAYVVGMCGKETLPPQMWDKISSTPAGRCVNSQGEYAPKVLSPEIAAKRASRVKLDMIDMAIGARIHQMPLQVIILLVFCICVLTSTI